MKTVKWVFKKLIKSILGEEIISYVLRAYMNVRTLLGEVLVVVAIRCYATYLKTFKAYRRHPPRRNGDNSDSSLVFVSPQAKNLRAKPHVLFVTERWCSCNPAMGPTNSEHNLFGSLEASGLATYDRFHFDEYRHQHNRPCDFALLQLCMESRPDLLFFSYCSGGLCPRWTTLGLIGKNMGIPIVTIWWDDIGDMAESALPFVDLNVALHSACLQRTSHPEKYLLMWSPQDPRVYYNPNMNRDIGISFVGSMKDYPDRLGGISALRSKGIDVYQSGGQREHRLSVDEYARILMCSKIALNFGLSGDGVQVAKGRLFEATLCGAMLLSTGNSETNIWFDPMGEYVPFANETDLVEKARYYLEHDAEREEIAARGYQKAKEKYTAEAFWGTIFGRVFGTSFWGRRNLR